MHSFRHVLSDVVYWHNCGWSGSLYAAVSKRWRSLGHTGGRGGGYVHGDVMTSWELSVEKIEPPSRREQFRRLCSDLNTRQPPNDKHSYRAFVESMENGEPAPSYPPLHVQIGNALTAGLKFLASGFKLVDAEEHARRLSICRGGCEFYDPDQKRCKACGCVDEWKAWLESQDCPKKKW
jgi:hypothetical protein